MIRYTLRQLMEGSVLTQTIISAGILPYLLLIPAVLSFSGGPVEISFMKLLNLNTFLPLRCSLPSLQDSIQEETTY